MPKIDILTAMKARRRSPSTSIAPPAAGRRCKRRPTTLSSPVAPTNSGTTATRCCAQSWVTKKSLTEAAAARGTVRRCDLEYVSQRFGECLQTLAEEFARQDRPRRRLGSAPMRQTAAGGGNAPAGFLLIPLADLAASKAHYIGIS